MADTLTLELPNSRIGIRLPPAINRKTCRLACTLRSSPLQRRETNGVIRCGEMRFLVFTAVCAALLAAPLAQAAKPLEIYFLDVEGGQSTLIVSPSGQAMLVDTGWRGFNGRDAERIVKAAKNAHVK